MALVQQWESLTDFIRLVLWSGFVKNGRPQSVFLVALPGDGKTELLHRFNQNSFVEVYSDITFQRLLGVMREAQEGKVTHLMVTEFQKVIGRRRAVADATISLLLQATEDGVFRVGYGPVDRNFEGARCGLLAASTARSIAQHAYLINDFALDSRVFFVDARWTREDMMKLRRRVADGDRSMLSKVTLPVPDAKVEIEMPKKLRHRVITWVTEMEKTKGVRVYGLRTQVRFEYVLMGIALSHGRETVKPSDLEQLYRFRRYWLRPINVPEDE